MKLGDECVSRIHRVDVKRAIEWLFENRFEYVHSRQVMACDGWQLVEAKVILRYSLDTACSYCKTADGTIVPNGYYVKEIDGDYQWSHGTKDIHATNRAPYGFSCYVKPIRIKIWRFPNDMTKVEEIRTGNGGFDYDETLKWLDALCGIAPSGKTKEIDYTQELGLFFKSVILYIINLNEKLKTVFGDDLEISLPAIEGVKLLLT